MAHGAVTDTLNGTPCASENRGLFYARRMEIGAMSKTQMTGAKMVVQALKDQGVEVVFGYPGGAVLPIYDEIFQQNRSATSLCATSKGLFMPLKAMRDRPANPVSRW